MRKTIRVAWREFKQTVMRPVFLVTILGIPLLIIGIGVVAALIMMSHKEPPLVGEIRIIAPRAEIIAAAKVEFDQARIASEEQKEQIERAAQAMQGQRGFVGGPGANAVGRRGEVNVTVVPAEAADSFENLKDRVRRGELLAVAEFSEETLAPPPPPSAASAPAASAPEKASREKAASFRLFVAESVDSDNVRLVERRLGKAAVRVRAERAGLSGEQAIALVREPRAETTRARVGGGEREDNEGLQEVRAQLIPGVFMMLIWVGAFSTGQMLLMSTIEEKSNRVMEVLLSAVSPLQLMTGKILGYGSVGLLIVTIYSSVGIGSLIAFALFTDLVQWSHLAYFAIFYLMAYSMISCIMAAVGSAVSDVREANTLVTPVMLVLMVPLMLWMPIAHDPNGPVATVCSFVPPAIPFAMILRIVSEEGVPTWQIILSIVWGYGCVLGMGWLAARIFRVGVLMYGKPPSPLELIKWARYS